MTKENQFPYLGFGLGLRPELYEDILNLKPEIDWFEIISENYLVPGGKPIYYLDKMRENYPLVMHGVSLSIGSTDPIDWDYLHALKSLAKRIEPLWISDHFCWTGINGLNMHDLLPLPYTEETLRHLVPRIQKIQEFLGQRIVLENVSTYLSYIHSDFSEWDFISQVAKEADCYLLLDLNNIYVSSVNHEFNPLDYLNALPAERIVQIHLAGHSDKGNYLIDTHDAPIIQPVWDLYAEAIKKFGPRSTMIERDDNIPPLMDLVAELGKARKITKNLHLKELCRCPL